MSIKKRVAWPDIAKGIGILLVVLDHTFIPRLREQFGYQFLQTYFALISMSLFFFISGWLFELKAEKYEQNKLKAIGSKFIHLMIPYFSFSVLYYILFNIALRIESLAPIFSMSNGGYEKSSLIDSAIQILTFENSMAKSLWFLYVLFIISVVNILFPKFMKNPIVVILLFFLPYITKVLVLPDIIGRSTLYFSFFSLARLLFNFTDKILAMKKSIYSLIFGVFILISAAYGICLYYDLFSNEHIILNYLHVLIRSVLSFFSLAIIIVGANYIANLKHGGISKFLTYIGQNSFIIYLIHAPILTQAVVSAMVKLVPFMPSFIDCLVGIAVGVGVSLLISEFILKKIPILNTIFTGAPYKKKTKAKHQAD